MGSAVTICLIGAATSSAQQSNPCEAPAGSIFLNEIHYDNDGTDTGERIEVAIPAGINASAVSVYLYNGNTPGSAVSYDVKNLGSAATITTTANSLWQLAVLNYSANGIQNGGNDGVAIVADCNGAGQLQVVL
eukprot:gene9802-9960_t